MAKRKILNFGLLGSVQNLCLGCTVDFKGGPDTVQNLKYPK